VYFTWNGGRNILTGEKIKENKNPFPEESSIQGNALGAEGICYKITWAVSDYVQA